MAETVQAPEAAAIRSKLRALANPDKERILLRFFKTGPGEYGAGDRFYGIVMPEVRKIVKAHARASRADMLDLLHSEFHEERMTALLILVEQYKRGGANQKNEIYRLYLEETAWINNWDLVDLTAAHIVGAHLFGKDVTVLTNLAHSPNLWERRISMLATHYFIRQGECREALRIARVLLPDSHDLIHKAVGWMLREVGKHCSREQLREFLDRHAAVMPRTMLRYAIEHFPEKLRQHYMHLS